MTAEPPPRKPWHLLGRAKLPITATLLVGFSGLVAVAVITVMLISILAARTNTEQLLKQAAVQGREAARARIERYLAPAADDVTFLAAQLSRDGSISLDDDPRIETLLRGSLGAAPQIDGLAFVRADLSSVRMRREENDRIDSISGSIAKKSYALELMEAAKRIKPSVDKPPLQWNPVLYVPELGVSFLSVMAPVRRDGKFAGVVLATVPVGELSRLIESSNPQSTMFILNASDGVVAHPFLTHGGFKPTVAHSELQRTELPDKVLQALWSPQESSVVIQDRFNGFPLWIRRVSVEGQSYYVLLDQMQRFSTQPWTFGIYFPDTAVSGVFDRLFYAAIAAGGILAVAVILALLMGRSLARPIKRLAEAAAAVSAFDFSGTHRPGGSPFRELDAAGRAWDSMLAALRWFETYVPKALVGQLLHESARSELKPEEREVTVMFTDIVSFSRIALRHAPGPLADFLNRHFGLIGRHVEAEHGTIDKYIGDSVMAFWGAPVSDPDHALHAARAALGIAETLAHDNRRRAKKGLAPVRIRIGLHTGLAIVGNVGAPGRVNYTLIGDTVNAAQRLEQLGKSFDDGTDCTVLASAALVAHLPNDIPRQAVGDQTLRGMGIFEVYRLGKVEAPAAAPVAS
jgi:adenylate cyclase